MFTFFSIIVILSPIAVIISAILRAISAVRKKPAKAKRVLAVSAALFVISFIGCALTAPPVEKKEAEEQPSAVQSTAPEQPQEPAQEPVSAPSGNQKEITPIGPKETSEGPQEPAQAAEPTNPLSALAVQEHPVMNGFKTERIGTWASITTTKEFFSNATDEQVFQYLNEVAENEYNWINVFFEDGTGLYCIGSMGGYLLDYGNLDQDEGGSVSDEDSRRIYNFLDDAYQLMEDESTEKTEQEFTQSEPQSTLTPEPDSEPKSVPAETDYVLNTGTRKFHYSWCSSVKDIKSSNRVDFTGTRNEIISRGYTACKRCNP